MISFKDDVCGHCKAINKIVWDYRGGRKTCEQCGCVAEQRFLDPTAEWNKYNTENPGNVEQGVRASQKYDFNQEVDGGCGLQLPGDMLETQKIDQYFRSKSDNRKVKGTQKIKEFCEKLELKENVRSEAKKIFNSIVQQTETFRGKGLDGIIASIIFMAARITQIPLESSAICLKTGVKDKELRRCYKKYKWKVKEYSYIKPTEYVHRFSSELKLAKDLSSFNALSKKIIDGGYLDGKNPRTIAGAVIYTVMYHKYGQDMLKIIAEVADKKENTVKNSYRKIQDMLKHLLPKEENNFKIHN